MNTIHILFLFIIIIIVIYFIYTNTKRIEYEPFKPINLTAPKIIWSYWENKPGSTRPEYIDLCLETFYKHNPDFKINILNEKTLYDYLPNIRQDINKLSLAHKSDYIRIVLLEKYGGIWLDADTIVMRNLTPIIDKLNNEEHDYIGFGCSYNICNQKISGYPKPSNQAQAAKPHNILMKRVLKNLNTFMDQNKNKQFGYFDMGKKLIWNSIDELKKEINYDYYHYNSAYDGSRDNLGRWINADNHISKIPTEFLDKDKLFFVFLENNKFMGKYKWFSELNKQQIINGPWWISQLFRESLEK